MRRAGRGAGDDDPAPVRGPDRLAERACRRRRRELQLVAAGHEDARSCPTRLRGAPRRPGRRRPRGVSGRTATTSAAPSAAEERVVDVDDLLAERGGGGDHGDPRVRRRRRRRTKSREDRRLAQLVLRAADDHELSVGHDREASAVRVVTAHRAARGTTGDRPLVVATPRPRRWARPTTSARSTDRGRRDAAAAGRVVWPARGCRRTLAAGVSGAARTRADLGAIAAGAGLGRWRPDVDRALYAAGTGERAGPAAGRWTTPRARSC